MHSISAVPSLVALQSAIRLSSTPPEVVLPLPSVVLVLRAQTDSGTIPVNIFL